MSSSSYSLTIRFPSGTEFWATEKLPEVGNTISRNGRRYLAVSSDQLSRDAFALQVAAEGEQVAVNEPSESGEPAYA